MGEEVRFPLHVPPLQFYQWLTFQLALFSIGCSIPGRLQGATCQVPLETRSGAQMVLRFRSPEASSTDSALSVFGTLQLRASLPRRQAKSARIAERDVQRARFHWYRRRCCLCRSSTGLGVHDLCMCLSPALLLYPSWILTSRPRFFPAELCQ